MAYYTMGILYLRGLMKQVLFGSKTIWYHELSNDLFADTISLNLFFFINRVIEFDDKKEKNEHWKFDKFECFRIFFEEKTNNNARYR